MFAYWGLFFCSFLFALQEHPRDYQVGERLSKIPVTWLVMFIFLTLLIGFRHVVGGDWPSYLRHLEVARSVSFLGLFTLKDPGYQILNYISIHLGGGIYTVNLISGSIFSLGLVLFCRTLPRPMLGVLTAIPYMTIVIAMGYTRQSIALGLVMIALTSLIHKSIFRFILWVILAALFHKSAMLFIPLAALLSSKNRLLNVFWVGIAAAISYKVLLADDVEVLYSNYIESQYHSEGALIRVIMCVFPALLFFYFQSLFNMSSKEKKLWSWLSILSIFSFTLLFLTAASTAVDRVALYLLPLQLVVFSYMPEILGNRGKSNIHWVLLICIYYASVQFVWLFFAHHAHAWLPYQFYPFTFL
ncbi:EpsG family protein [Vibrio pelagius]|uniref:EpsG family protein n=1 Tax=Vibrio pelagius TaxID=28169 RepID=UPI00354B835E